VQRAHAFEPGARPGQDGPIHPRSCGQAALPDHGPLDPVIRRSGAAPRFPSTHNGASAQAHVPSPRPSRPSRRAGWPPFAPQSRALCRRLSAMRDGSDPPTIHGVSRSHIWTPDRIQVQQLARTPPPRGFFENWRTAHTASPGPRRLPQTSSLEELPRHRRVSIGSSVPPRACPPASYPTAGHYRASAATQLVAPRFWARTGSRNRALGR